MAPDRPSFSDNTGPPGGGVPAAPDRDGDLELVSELVGLLIWSVDPATGAISWISGTGHIDGFPLLDSFAGYLEINHPDDRDAVYLAFSRWLAGTHPLDIEHRILLPSGKTIWLRSRGRARTADQPRLLGIAQDITAYRQRQSDADLLATIQDMLETTTDIGPSLRSIGELLCGHLHLDSIVFADISEPDDRITLLHEGLSTVAPRVSTGDTRRLSDFMSPEIAATLAAGRPVAVADTLADPRLVRQRPQLEENALRAVLCIPFVQEGRWSMLLCASHQTPHAWQDHEQGLLTDVSERLSLRLERSRAQVDLRHSEEQFRSIFEKMDDGFCVIEMIYDAAGDPVDYRFVMANPAFEHHTTMRDVVGRRMREIIPTHEDDWFDIYGEVDRTRKPVRFVNEARALNNRWFDLNAFPVGDPSQHQVAVLFTDITERLRATESLKEFQARVQRALEIESVGIIFFQPDGPVTYANSAFLRMSGYTSEDVAAGRVRWDTMTPPEWMPNARRAITEFLSFDRIAPYEKEYIRKDGTRWWGLFAASRISGTEGVKFIIDISATKQAEAERIRLADIVEDSNDAIIRCEADGEIVDVNHAALELYGYVREEIVGMNIMDTAPPARRDEFAEKYARLLCGEHVPPWETVRYAKSGVPLQVEIRMSPIRDAHGTIIGCSGVVRDITERKRLEQAQEDFLAMASHDLKSPVTVLLGRAQLMRRRKTYDEAAIRTIIDQARRIERLATDLQHVVRIEAGKMEFRPVRVDLVALVREAVERVQTPAGAFTFHVSVPGDPVVGHWDKLRISQVLDNLLINAVKYSPEGGAIEVAVIPGESEIELRVTDQGVGISQEFQQRLFTRFYRADKEGVSAGLGLGLYISRMLVEAHGGDIRVISTPGEGSTFTVRLPRNAAERDAAHTTGTGAHAAS